MTRRRRDGHHVGTRHLDPRHRDGDWWPSRGNDRDLEHQGGWNSGRRPPLADNADRTRKETR